MPEGPTRPAAAVGSAPRWRRGRTLDSIWPRRHARCMGTVLLVTAALLVTLGVALVSSEEPARTVRPARRGSRDDRPAHYGAAVAVGLLAVVLLGAAVAFPML